ncbi:MAG: thioredoxin fold domain-containing protein [Campylobacterales bacterium]|nr:thioredoxin fold domain-containing protein [Campylobacterales bacterium]
MIQTKFRMIFTMVLIVFLTITQANGATGKFTGGQDHEMPKWFKESFLELKEDISEAKAKNKHLMMFMTLSFCPYCTKMIKNNFEIGTKNQKYIQENFDVVGIDIKGSREITLSEDSVMTEKEYAAHLGIQYTPTILFFDHNGEIVVRLNGYRSPENFKLILDFVKNKEYKNMSLTQYLEKVKSKTLYSLQPNPMFKDLNDLSTINGPLAVIFEDGSCTQCSYLHNTTLKNKDVVNEMSKFTVVRFDATSEQPIITPKGEKTTPAKWAKDMVLDYRPGIVLFNKNEEIIRIDALLYSFHFKELFRYVSGEHYVYYPTFLDYLKPRQTELLNNGINIDISDK